MPPTTSIPKIHTPAANTAAVVLYPSSGLARRYRLDKILASYNAAPTGGRLTVVVTPDNLPDGTVRAAQTIIDVDVTAAGLLPDLDWPPDGLRMPIDGAVTVTLAAAGAAVTGKLNVAAHPE